MLAVEMQGCSHPADPDGPICGLRPPEDQPPSRVRRVAVAVFYLVLIFMAYGALVVAVDPLDCLGANSCRISTSLLIDCITVGWCGLSFAAAIAGWKGLLPGARARRSASLRSATE